MVLIILPTKSHDPPATAELWGFEVSGFGASSTFLPHGSFRKLGYLIWGVLIIRILLFRVLYWDFGSPLIGSIGLLGSRVFPLLTLVGSLSGFRASRAPCKI